MTPPCELEVVKFGVSIYFYNLIHFTVMNYTCMDISNQANIMSGFYSIVFVVLDSRGCC